VLDSARPTPLQTSGWARGRHAVKGVKLVKKDRYAYFRVFAVVAWVLRSALHRKGKGSDAPSRKVVGKGAD
jgi:hypothetical protein